MSVIEKSTEGPNPLNDVPVSKSSSIFQGVLTFGLLSGVAYFASLLKTLVITRYFGTSAQMDAYAMAVLVPNLLAALLAGLGDSWSTLAASAKGHSFLLGRANPHTLTPAPQLSKVFIS